MKNKLLLFIMLLFAGVNLNAQSVAQEQMDERFNDGTTMPYGWFGEGWKVDKGVHQSMRLPLHQPPHLLLLLLPQVQSNTAHCLTMPVLAP